MMASKRFQCGCLLIGCLFGAAIGCRCENLSPDRLRAVVLPCQCRKLPENIEITVSVQDLARSMIG